MKQIITVLFLLCAVLTACSKNTSTTENTVTTTVVTTATTTQTEIKSTTTVVTTATTTSTELTITTMNDNLNKVDFSAIDVSIIQLIANPSEYHGKKVRVIGVGNLEFEGDGLYLSKDDLKYGTNNSLWLVLSLDATPYEDAMEYNGKYVLVEGTFDMNNKGHFGMWLGAIVDITRYINWESKK